MLLLIIILRRVHDSQVAEYLVQNIRSFVGNGSMKPTYIRFLTGLKAYTQIFSVK